MLENHIPVNRLREGDEIVQFFLIKKSETRQTRTGKWYIDFLLGDQTGEMVARLWDQQPESHFQYPVGSLVKIKGRIDKFQDQLQLQIEKIRMAQPEQDGVELKDFVKSSPIPVETMWNALLEKIESIESPVVKGIVNQVINKHEQSFKTWPAARDYHHNYLSGLIYHTYRMILLAENCCQLYPFLNRDILLGGVVLHDIGKIAEMSAEMGSVTEYSTRGKLIGHITEAILWIEHAASELGFEGEDVLLLQHMVASHHGKLEYGSPVTPKIPEAEILHWLDMMDSRMGAVEDAVLNKHPDESWTERIKILGTNMYTSRSDAK